MDGADQVVMACVGGWWWWQDRQSQKKKSGKKKKGKRTTGWPIRGGVETNGGSCTSKTAIDAGSRSPTMAFPPPRPIRRAQTSPGEGRRAGRACRGGMAGREAVRRRHSLQAMRSRSSDSAPGPPLSHGRGGPMAAVHLPGCRRRHMDRPSTRTENPVDVSLPQWKLTPQGPTATPGTTADGTAGNVFQFCSHRPPPLRNFPSPDPTPGSPLAPRPPSQASQQAAAGGPNRRDALQWSSWISTQWSPSPDGGTGGMFGVRCAGSWPCPVASRHGGAWSMEQGAGSREQGAMEHRRLGPGARWRERLPWTILPKRCLETTLILAPVAVPGRWPAVSGLGPWTCHLLVGLLLL